MSVQLTLAWRAFPSLSFVHVQLSFAATIGFSVGGFVFVGAILLCCYFRRRKLKLNKENANAVPVTVRV